MLQLPLVLQVAAMLLGALTAGGTGRTQDLPQWLSGGFPSLQPPLEPSQPPLEPSQRHLEPSQPPQQPSIEGGVSRNVTAVVGMTATLACRVNNIGSKTAPTVPHLPRLTPALHLSEPETVIAGGPDVYINVGSRLVLTCLVKFTPESPAFIFWYHDRKLVSYERTRSSSSSISSSSSHASRSRGEGEALEVSMERGEVTTSSLLVQAARQSHSGRYTCTPANSRPASVNVHVLQGT
ncbi:hypothetical protein O3P69_014643 [Scylla paramamosain]|uniref:Ig-like domain-containing protein n=1 Tax=Scylla paramamosain TaxID=85552 RepID=A0AAW0U0U6_SCYPA